MTQQMGLAAPNLNGPKQFLALSKNSLDTVFREHFTDKGQLREDR